QMFGTLPSFHQRQQAFFRREPADKKAIPSTARSLPWVGINEVRLHSDAVRIEPPFDKFRTARLAESDVGVDGMAPGPERLVRADHRGDRCARHLASAIASFHHAAPRHDLA